MCERINFLSHTTAKAQSTYEGLREAIVETLELPEQELGEVEERDVLGNGDEVLAVDDLPVQNEAEGFQMVNY